MPMTPANKAPLPPQAELAWWYQFYYATERGPAGYEQPAHISSDRRKSRCYEQPLVDFDFECVDFVPFEVLFVEPPPRP